MFRYEPDAGKFVHKKTYRKRNRSEKRVKSTSSDDELVLMFLNKKLKILGSSSPDTGRNSWFDAGLEALS